MDTGLHSAHPSKSLSVNHDQVHPGSGLRMRLMLEGPPHGAWHMRHSPGTLPPYTDTCIGQQRGPVCTGPQPGARLHPALCCSADFPGTVTPSWRGCLDTPGGNPKTCFSPKPVAQARPEPQGRPQAVFASIPQCVGVCHSVSMCQHVCIYESVYL